MNKETIYIPGFGNLDDKIRKNALPDATIVQKSMKLVNTRKLIAFLLSSNFKEMQRRVLKKYPSTTEADFIALLLSLKDFKGYARSLDNTVGLTKKRVSESISEGNIIKISGHSQGGLVSMEMILRYPELLEHIEEIELFAPVTRYSLGQSFHIDPIKKVIKKPYISRKGVIIRKEYLDSLERADYSLLICLAIRLKTCGYKGKFKIMYSKNDPVIPESSLDLESVKRIYPDVEIICVDAEDHYLGFKNI